MVFLHVGMSKAGSSAIQRCLVDNRRILARHGISYPTVGMPGSDGIAHHDIKSDLERDSTEMLQKALDDHNGDVVILSCEGFWLLDDDKLELLADALSAYEVNVIFYLRNLHDYLPSSYRQNIKRTGEHCPPEDYFDPSRSNLKQDFSYQLDRWGQHFSLRVRAYEAVKQGIERDFMQAIGAPMDQVDVSRQAINTTPPDGAIQLMLLANRYLPRRLSRYARRFIRWSDYDFDLMPPVEDEVFHEYADAVIQRWDTDVIREHLPEDEWNLLISRRN